MQSVRHRIILWRCGISLQCTTGFLLFLLSCKIRTISNLVFRISCLSCHVLFNVVKKVLLILVLKGEFWIPEEIIKDFLWCHSVAEQCRNHTFQHFCNLVLHIIRFLIVFSLKVHNLRFCCFTYPIVQDSFMLFVCEGTDYYLWLRNLATLSIEVKSAAQTVRNRSERLIMFSLNEKIF